MPTWWERISGFRPVGGPSTQRADDVDFARLWWIVDLMGIGPPESLEITIQPLLDALADDPLDLATRLVLADWLEERGDERSDLLRQWAPPLAIVYRVPMQRGRVNFISDVVDRKTSSPRQSRTLCTVVVRRGRRNPAGNNVRLSKLFPTWKGRIVGPKPRHSIVNNHAWLVYQLVELHESPVPLPAWCTNLLSEPL